MRAIEKSGGQSTAGGSGGNGRLNLTLRHKLTGFAAVLIMIIAAMGTVGYTVAQSLTGVLAPSTTTALALRNPLEADLMHDALRGDVLSALHRSEQHTAELQSLMRH